MNKNNKIIAIIMLLFHIMPNTYTSNFDFSFLSLTSKFTNIFTLPRLNIFKEINFQPIISEPVCAIIQDYSPYIFGIAASVAIYIEYNQRKQTTNTIQSFIKKTDPIKLLSPQEEIQEREIRKQEEINLQLTEEKIKTTQEALETNNQQYEILKNQYTMAEYQTGHERAELARMIQQQKYTDHQIKQQEEKKRMAVQHWVNIEDESHKLLREKSIILQNLHELESTLQVQEKIKSKLQTESIFKFTGKYSTRYIMNKKIT